MAERKTHVNSHTLIHVAHVMGSKYTVMEAIHVYNPHEATDAILKAHLDLI